jgi:glycosyltransferase involved in cell wall biosynthesis
MDSVVPWEVLLVDNASTDSTVEVARTSWGNGPVPLRIVKEPDLGLQRARERGRQEANYDLLGFVDDDNWVAADFVQRAAEAFESDPTLGALGSVCEPVFDAPEPPWFRNFDATYAILSEIDPRIKLSPPYLHGAGLFIRKIAWTRLVEGGFHSLLTDRVGGNLSGGGDTELTWAIRLAGWKILVDPSLKLQHFMPAQRLRWDYLRKLKRSYALSMVLLDAYTEHSLSLKPGPRTWFSDQWWYQFSKSALAIAKRPAEVLAALCNHGEGRDQILDIEEHFGRARGLLHYRGRYGTSRRGLREATWKYSP